MLKEEERVKFTFENEIKVGKCLLKIHYSGIHNDKRMGFYRSKFTVSNFHKNLKYFKYAIII
jgi:hypothetical protein